MVPGVKELVIAPAVSKALAARAPVVALETTVATHGLPPPEGVDTALEMEASVRAEGAVPATIGVLDGRIIVGLGEVELRRLAAEPAVAKLNTSNLAAGVASGAAGSLTVAATLFAAHRSGLRVFATGGVGGVHQDAPQTGDVSADLGALARYPMAVVCSGAKAILDLPRTREALETLGVPVLGFGTDELPAFYTRRSGVPVDARFDSIEELARAIAAHFTLSLGTGVVVGNPIPEADELPADLCRAAIEKALAAARSAGASGRAATPALLEAMREATGGLSVRANRALLRHNATIAGRLARALVILDEAEAARGQR